MHVVRKSEGGRDEIKRNSKRKKAEFHVRGNTLKGSKKPHRVGLTGLSVLDGVVSSVLSSSVVLW